MSAPDLTEVLETAKTMLVEAKQEGKLNHLTNRIVRQEVEQTLSLDPGTLDQKEYKRELNKFIEAFVNELDSEGEEPSTSEKIIVKPEVTKKRKSEADGSKTKAKKKVSQPKSEEKPKNASKKTRVSKSKKAVLDSDDEDNDKVASPSTRDKIADSENQESKSKRGTAKDGTPTTSSPKEMIASTSKVSGPKPEPKLKPVAVTKKPDVVPLPSAGNKSKAENDGAVNSGSELSVLIDEPPKKKKGKEKEKVSQLIRRMPLITGIEPFGSLQKTKATSVEKRSRSKSAKELSPDEETIKRLKSLVYACGVRKLWSKELQDLDTPSRQISHIRSILSNLGMKGRFSMEQAKSIKEKRELAQEIEDVREFAGKHAGRANSNKSVEDHEEDESEDDDDDDSANAPKRRKLNAQKSILAFLEDQSDE